MDDTAAPLWLDDFFLIQVLQSAEETKQEIEVVKFWCRPAVPPGNNYLSQLYRVSVDYKMEHAGSIRSAAFIVKTPVEHGQQREFFEAVNIYERELQMYREILPKMYELHNSRITARSFFCPLEKSLVLEDLKPCGYVMADRVRQLDLPHCRQFLISLARFHAMSVAVHSKHPQEIESLGKFNCYSDEQQQLRALVGSSLRGMVNTIEKLNGCERYAEMIRSIIDTYWDKMVQLFKNKEGLRVLNHGDPWTANALFKYDDAGDIIDVKLVDFQLCRFCSFAPDVIFFWWTSANEEVRGHHRKELFEVYRKTLNKTLQELGCSERLSEDDFGREMKAFASYSFHAMSSLLAIAMADPEDMRDPKSIQLGDPSTPEDENSSRWKNYRSKYYKAVLTNMLRQVEDFGAFE